MQTREPHAGASWIALAIVAICGGCGGTEGLQRYDVQGKVTFQGQPVPAGMIVFEPDPAAGNSGPQAVAEIRDGHYNTRQSGKGHVGGPHLVTIIGSDADASGEGYSEGETAALFPPYTTKIDLPRERASQDFDVPGRP